MSTIPRGTESSRSKHKDTIKATSIFKRRRTSGEESTSKKGKKEKIAASSLTESKSRADTELDNSLSQASNEEEMAGKLDIKSEIATALSDPAIMKMLSQAFALQITEDMNKKLEALEQRETKVEMSVEGIKTDLKEFKQSTEVDLDEIKQRDKCNNVIISGLQEQQTSKEEICQIINDKVKCSAQPADIIYTLKLKSKRSEENGKLSVRVAFATHEKKKQVMKAKKNLRGENDEIWIVDDLTAYRSNLAYLCRQAVKKGHAHQTWTSDGKVFVKKKEASKPAIIRRTSDIPDKEI